MSAMGEMQVGAGTPEFGLPRLGEGWRKPLPPPNEFYRPAARPRVARGTLVIGLSGAAGSGKNTVAEHLMRMYGPRHCGGGMDMHQYALADALKIEVFDWLNTLRFYLVNTQMFDALGYNVPMPGWEGEVTDAQKITWINLNKTALREILQKHGTELRRAQDDSYWVDRLLERVAEDSPQVALLTDVRFANEIAICHANVKVEMVGQVEDPGVAAHVSEREWQEYDFGPNVVRAAKGDLGTLKRESERVFEQILTRFHVQ